MNLFKIHSNKGTREISLPNCWSVSSWKSSHKDDKPNPINTDQFQKTVADWDGEDLVKLFSILSGIEYKALSNTHDFVLEEQLLASTRFVYDTAMDFRDAAPPHWIELNGKKIRIPVKIGDLSIGQNIHVRQAMEKSKVYEELISFVVAIYLQPLYDGADFDYHRAMELEQDIKKLPIEKTYPLGVFFLRKLTKPGRSILSRLNFLITRLQVTFSKNESLSQNTQE